MTISLRKVGDSWAVSLYQVELKCQELASAALSALDLSRKLGLPVELASEVPLDARGDGELLFEQLQRERARDC